MSSASAQFCLKAARRAAHGRCRRRGQGSAARKILIARRQAGIACIAASAKTLKRACVFASREPTGETWTGEARDDDLILTRILTLDGLEDGVNRGPGHDSLERYIYLHGTNHERLLGRPVSHGCIRLSNADICSLFEGNARGRSRADRRAGIAHHSRSTRRGTVPLCRHRRLGHERARPVPGDDRWTRERQRPRLRSRRARRAHARSSKASASRSCLRTEAA